MAGSAQPAGSWPACLAPFIDANGLLLLDGSTAADWPGRITLARAEWRVLEKSKITAAGVRAMVAVKKVFPDAVVVEQQR